MEELKLKRLEYFSGRPGPLVLIIMDGIGIGNNEDDNAFYLAKTPFLDEIQREYPKKKLYIELKAHGTAVGLPTDSEMGNSEVGHNAIGGGNVVKQRALISKEAIESKNLFQSLKWKELVSSVKKKNKTLHLIGLLSDGYVHSHITHLVGLLRGAKESGIRKVRIHVLLDGRDVPPQSALDYIDMLKGELEQINSETSYDYRIASGGGRMRVTMDRYNSDWGMVQRGWEAHVCGFPEILPNYPGFFKSAREAVETARRNDPDISDQYLPSFVVADHGNQAIGHMENGDVVLFFNFRGDRALQISRAFDEGADFDDFLKICEPNVSYYGLMQYDEKENIPRNYLLDPPFMKESLTKYLCATKITQFAIAETHKFGHVTYFYNGNKEGYVDETLEKYVEIKSDPSETIKDRPKMKAFEVTEELEKTINSGMYKYLRVNLANGDMVGHTGDKAAAIIAAETVDTCVKKIVELVNKMNGITVITADHGNLEEMNHYKTSHTLNPVMFAIVDSMYNGEYEINENIDNPQLGNVAATLVNLLGYEKPTPFMESLIRFK
ncbi:MAG: 2,3-bisphosphoglycerate-independent phosphoglycerate mutase [Candidatus Lokiarchaeota archaeon]|nr:2,3-bisphosphoglycerate-independent phosphoglycerate mutase [Candidatus Lokiarchaeota archaeon]